MTVLALLVAVSCTDDGVVASDREASGETLAPTVGATPEATSTPAPEPTPTPEGPQPLIVATYLGEQGVMAPLDGPALAGISAKIDELNEQGGVLGREIVLQRFDTTSRLSVMARYADRITNTQPDLIVVSCDVEFSRPMLQAAADEGMVTISPCANDAGYLTGAWGSRNFTLGAPAELQGALAADAAIGNYGLKAMVLKDTTSPEANSFCDGFEANFIAAGGVIVAKYEFTYDSFDPTQDRLAEEGPVSDMIVLCSHIPGEIDAAPSIINVVRTLGFQAPILSGQGLDNATWFATVPLLNDLTFVSWSSIHGNDPDSDVNSIVRRANEDETTPPAGSTTILGAEAVDAWVRAVERMGSANQGQVAAALGGFNSESFATGEISFLTDARMDADRRFRVLRVQGGNISVQSVREVGG